MSYLLDTNAVIALGRNDASVLARLALVRADEVATSSIVFFELFFGAFNSARIDENISKWRALRFRVLDFSYDDALRAGELRAALKAVGKPIGAYDILIAGQALARSLVLVTHNTAEFARVPGLAIEDWEA